MMIESSQTGNLADFDFGKYDTVVFSVGTELRSIQLFQTLSNHNVKSAAYIHNHHSFIDEAAGGEILDRQIDLEILHGTLFSDGQHESYRCFLESSQSVLVDVSCMTRSMMAEQVLYLSEYAQAGLKVDFAYLPSVFSQPVHEYPKIRRIGAAAPQFSGYDFRPADPVALVLGLGHEYGVSIGLMNQMEPKIAVAFRSVGIDNRFDEAVLDANFGFDFSPYSASVIDVDITRPEECFSVIENVLSNLITDHRVIVIPSGPKIFALFSILGALQHLGKVAIFRVDHARTLSLGKKSDSIIRFSMGEDFKSNKLHTDWLAP